MKLSDLTTVGRLQSELDYLHKLRSCVGRTPWRLVNMDVRPDLIRALQPHASSVINDAIKAVYGELAELGVTIDDGGEL